MGCLTVTKKNFIYFLRKLLNLICVFSREMNDGSNQYFIKWRDLPYVDCSWEDDDMDIPDYQTFIKHFEDLRFVCGADGRKKKKKKKGDDSDDPKRRYNPPPDKPTTDLDNKYTDNKMCKWMPEGLSLHPYQLEGKYLEIFI